MKEDKIKIFLFFMISLSLVSSLVQSQESLNFRLLVSPDRSFTEEKKDFNLHNVVYLGYSSSVREIEVSAILKYPDGNESRIDLPTSLRAEVEGEYILSAVVSGVSGERTIYNISFFVSGERGATTTTEIIARPTTTTEMDSSGITTTTIAKDCEGYCGTYSPAGCWCDTLCQQNGNCCADACETCGICPAEFLPEIKPIYLVIFVAIMITLAIIFLVPRLLESHKKVYYGEDES